MKSGQVIWITGLSGSGKTTLATQIYSELNIRKIPVILLDGDEIRKILNSKNSFELDMERSARLEVAFKYAKLCKYLSDQNFIVIISTISLFKEIHLWNRDNISNYYEVFLDVPIELLIKRDSKNIYSDFQKGIRKNVAGMDLKVDFPSNPDRIVSMKNEVELNIVASEIIYDVLRG